MGVGCSNEGIDLLPENGAAEGDDAEEGMGEELMPPLNNEETERLSDTNAAPVLAERDGKFYQVYEVATVSYTGKVVEYYPDSTEASEKIYDLGVLTRQTEWHDNGQKKMEGTFANGEKDGLSVTWYSNGKKWQEQHHKEGKPHGIWKLWGMDGKLVSEKTYENGFLDNQDYLKPEKDSVSPKP